ncbi:hypothetical protein HOE04_03805 [archaeon]|jgi:hypothetical protein|nr:hypothetical protein [archaeon]
MTEKILSWKVVTPGRNLEIFMDNNEDINSTNPGSYERVKSVGRSVTRTGIMMAVNTAYLLGVMEVASYLIRN